MLNFKNSLKTNRLALVFLVLMAAFAVQPDHRLAGQELPVISLVDVQPSPVEEGETLRITLGIDEPRAAGAPTLIGGIRVWDSAKSSLADALIAFAFHPGNSSDVLSYRVSVLDDGGEVAVGRTIRIDINRCV